MSSLFALVFGLVVAIASCNVIPESRIVGGSNARQNELQFAASLQTPQHGHFCGATVISDRWVISAASCLQIHWVGSFTVRTGTHTYNRGGTEHTVVALIWHERFDYNSRSNDIALIKTTNRIIASAQTYTAYATIPTTNNHKTGIVSGWGQTQVNGQKSVYLQYYETPIITNEDCKTKLKIYNYDRLIQNTNVCSLSHVGQGICRSDSGSSLTNGHELIGIASFGVSCATGVPDVFTKVSQYSSWISTTQKNN